MHFFLLKFWTCSYCYLSCLNYSPILSSTGPFPCYVCCLLDLLLFAIFYYWKNTCVSQLGGIFGLSAQLYYFLLCISSPSIVTCLCFLNNMLLQHMYEQTQNAYKKSKAPNLKIKLKKKKEKKGLVFSVNVTTSFWTKQYLCRVVYKTLSAKQNSQKYKEAAVCLLEDTVQTHPSCLPWTPGSWCQRIFLMAAGNHQSLLHNNHHHHIRTKSNTDYKYCH